MKYSRAIIDSIHNGELEKADFETYPIFNLHIPKKCAGVPDEVLHPVKAWKGPQEEYQTTVKKLSDLFVKNFDLYKDQADAATIAAGPKYTK